MTDKKRHGGCSPAVPFSVRLRLRHALEELEGLFELGVDMVGLQSLAHAAFDVRAHDLLVGAFEERLRGEIQYNSNSLARTIV